jgi:hypothetical protein
MILTLLLHTRVVDKCVLHSLCFRVKNTGHKSKYLEVAECLCTC